MIGNFNRGRLTKKKCFYELFLSFFSGNPSTIAKSLNFDEKLLKTEPKVQFSNSEILVQRHGKLVQLLLTPSTSKKIRNGITLQVKKKILTHSE